MKKLSMAVVAVGLLALPLACTRSENQPAPGTQPSELGTTPSEQPADQGGGMAPGATPSQPEEAQPAPAQPGQNP